MTKLRYPRYRLRPGDMATRDFPFLWDYDIDGEQFRKILAGRASLGRLDRDWAALRLIEHGSYRDIVQILGFRELIAGWPRWHTRVRSMQRRRGLDFLVSWLPRHRPELCR